MISQGSPLLISSKSNLGTEMISKKIEHIDFTDIQRLIDDSVCEHRTLDYKRDLPANNDAAKKEFLADICSFANASGGDLIFGLGEKKDLEGKNTGAPEFYGLPADLNTDLESQRLQNIILDGAKPRIPLFNIRFIEGSDKKYVAVIRVLKSWLAPHMVTFKTSPSFFSRSSVGRQALDVIDIRNAFIGGEQLTEKISAFRSDRLGKILGDEMPSPLTSSRRVVCHLVPLQSLNRLQTVNLNDVYDHNFMFPPLGGHGFSRRFNLNGLVANAEKAAYLQLYRDGKIESVDGLHIIERGGGLGIPHLALERHLMDLVKRSIEFYRRNEVQPPVIIMLSLLNAKGGTITIDQWQFDQGSPIAEQHLILPEVLVDDFALSPDEIMRPLFDMIWNAAGHNQCLNYNSEGLRTR